MIETQMVLDFVDSKIESLEDYLDNLRPEEEFLRDTPEHDLIMFKKITEMLESTIKKNEQLKFERDRYKRLSEIRQENINNRILTIKEFIDNCSDKKVKKILKQLFYSEVKEYDSSKKIRKLEKENEQLKQEIEAFKMEIAELKESKKDNYNITDGLY